MKSLGRLLKEAGFKNLKSRTQGVLPDGTVLCDLVKATGRAFFCFGNWVELYEANHISIVTFTRATDYETAKCYLVDASEVAGFRDGKVVDLSKKKPQMSGDLVLRYLQVYILREQTKKQDAIH